VSDPKVLYNPTKDAGIYNLQLLSVAQCWKTDPNRTSAKIKLTPPADYDATLLLVSSPNFGQSAGG